MTAGTFQQQGLSMRVGSPILANTQSEGSDLSSRVTDYEHQKGAKWGDLSARVGFRINMPEVSEWIDRGLGRDVLVTSAGGSKVWNGFVNQIEIRVGAITITLGPLIDIANTAGVHFTLEDVQTDPPIEGGDLDTTLAQNLDSVERYGWWEKWFDGGTRTIADAEKLRDTILAARAWPQAVKSLAIAETPAISIDCLGYYAWLSAFTYKSASIYTTTVSDKIIALLVADPNEIFSVDYSHIDANAWLAPLGELEYKTAQTILEELMALGDVDDVPWFFTIEEDRVATFQQMSEQIEYYMRVTEADELHGEGRAMVRPWAIEAGKWIMIGDLLTGAVDSLPTNYDELMADSRCIFIDNLTYTMPYDVQLNGVAVGRLPQYLAKLGLGNM